jgi:bla regulator protein blaR1
MSSLQILPSLTEAFLWLLRGSARAAIAVAAVLIVRTVFRRRLPARWRYALWLAVPIAWLLPQLPRTPIGVVQYADPQVVRYVMALDSETISAPATPSRQPAIAAPAQSHRFTWKETGSMVWTAGAAILVVFWTIAHRRGLRRIRDASRSPDPAILELVRECGQAAGLRRLPETIESSVIPSPAVTGMFRPLLLLPPKLKDRFSRDELRLMLLHELAHIRRGDLITHFAAAGFLALHWFNPILWFAGSRMRADRESACDATVLGIAATDERAAYGGTLLKLQSELPAGHEYPAFIGILENTGRIRERILRIAAFRRGGVAWGLSAIAITAGILACLAADPPALAPKTANTASNAAPSPEQQLSLEQRLRRLTVKSQQIEFSSSIRELTEADLRVLKSDFPSLSVTSRPPGTFSLVGLRDAAQIAALTQKLSADADSKRSVVSTVASETGVRPLAERIDEKIFPNAGSKKLVVPTVTSKAGQRAAIEIIREFRHPITWEDPDPRIPQDTATPTSFETRSLGATLQLLGSVPFAPHPYELATIDLEITPQLAFFVGWEPGKTPGNYPTKSAKFSESPPSQTSITVMDGQTILFFTEMDIPDDNPWGLKDVGAGADVVATHRGTLLWLVSPRLVNSKGEPGLSDQILSRELFLPRDWQFTNMPVEQCISYFTGMSRLIDPNKRGLNIVLGKAPQEVRNVTLDLKRTSLINALEMSAKAAGLRVEEGADNTVILTP